MIIKKILSAIVLSSCCMFLAVSPNVKADTSSNSYSESEPNDDSEHANSIDVRNLYSGTIATSDDVDFFKVSLKESDSVVVGLVDNDDGSCLVKYDLYELGSNCEMVKMSPVSGESDDTYSLVGGKTYYLKITPNQYKEGGSDYRFALFNKHTEKSVDIYRKCKVGDVFDIKSFGEDTTPATVKKEWRSANPKIVEILDKTSGHMCCKAAGTVDVLLVYIYEDGKESKCPFTILVEDVTRLENIKCNRGKVEQTADNEYTVTLGKKDKSVKITPKISGKDAVYLINGKNIKDITVKVGRKKTKEIEVKVTDQEGTSLTYKIVIKRK